MSSITLKRVRTSCESAENAIEVTLFEDRTGRVCGSFIGPVQINETGVGMAFLPRSDCTIASVAVVRAVEAARKADLPLCVVDPDDLWGNVWRS